MESQLLFTHTLRLSPSRESHHDFLHALSVLLIGVRFIVGAVAFCARVTSCLAFAGGCSFGRRVRASMEILRRGACFGVRDK